MATSICSARVPRALASVSSKIDFPHCGILINERNWVVARENRWFDVCVSWVRVLVCGSYVPMGWRAGLAASEVCDPRW